MHNSEAEWRACKVCQEMDIPLHSVVRGEPRPEWDESLAGPEYHMWILGIEREYQAQGLYRCAE